MEKWVIAAVVIVTIAAHVWLYRWVKFKLDEGLILEFLQDSGPSCDDSLDFELISTATRLTAERVVAVCSRSQAIQQAQTTGGKSC